MSTNGDSLVGWYRGDDELFLLDLKREGASKDYVHKPFQVSGRPCDGDPFGLSSRGVAWRGYIAKEVYHREG